MKYVIRVNNNTSKYIAKGSNYVIKGKSYVPMVSNIEEAKRFSTYDAANKMAMYRKGTNMLGLFEIIQVLLER